MGQFCHFGNLDFNSFFNDFQSAFQSGEFFSVCDDYNHYSFLYRFSLAMKDFNEAAEVFIHAYIFKRRTAEKIVEKVRELVFPDPPDFDIIKPPEDFFEEDADWEFYRERLFLEKEKRIVLKERMLETIYFYAENDEELRSMVKNI